MDNLSIPSPLQELSIPNDMGIQFLLKRDDLIHPLLSGNKWRKLKYQIAYAHEHSYTGILTFGGAYSNHIVATAVAANTQGLKSIGIIRGEETSMTNHTLQEAIANNMKLLFVSRQEYSQKEKGQTVQQYLTEHPDYLLVPEGGKHQLALKGVGEIVDEVEEENINQIDYMICAIGTGTTFAGLANTNRIKHLIGIPVLKHSTLKAEIEQSFSLNNLDSSCELIHDYHFGGYAKFDATLIDFMHEFYYTYQIPTDVVYTSKLMFAVMDLLQKKYFKPNSTVVIYHSGGLQGNAGMNERFPNLVKF